VKEETKNESEGKEKESIRERESDTRQTKKKNMSKRQPKERVREMKKRHRDKREWRGGGDETNKGKCLRE
jgi:hypothetical protein